MPGIIRRANPLIVYLSTHGRDQHGLLKVMRQNFVKAILRPDPDRQFLVSKGWIRLGPTGDGGPHDQSTNKCKRRPVHERNHLANKNAGGRERMRLSIASSPCHCRGERDRPQNSSIISKRGRNDVLLDTLGDFSRLNITAEQLQGFVLYHRKQARLPHDAAA
jgi:hypothetical protein